MGSDLSAYNLHTGDELGLYFWHLAMRQCGSFKSGILYLDSHLGKDPDH